MISRRSFLRWLGAGASALALPELLLPKKTIFLPPAGGWRDISSEWAMWEWDDSVRPLFYVNKTIRAHYSVFVRDGKYTIENA